MQVQIRKTQPGVEPDGEWHITGLSGILEGIVLGTCEGISLNSVAFHAGYMVGRPTAIWGVTLTEDAHRAATSARDLGVGRPFSPLRGQVRVFRHEDQFLTQEQRPLKGADKVFLFRNGMFVQNGGYSYVS